MLKEMGLTPLWHARGDVAQALTPAAVAEDVSPLAVATVQTAARETSRSVPASAIVRPDTGNADERRDAIARMDWAALKSAVAECVACALHARRNKTVFGVG